MYKAGDLVYLRSSTALWRNGTTAYLKVPMSLLVLKSGHNDFAWGQKVLEVLYQGANWTVYESSCQDPWLVHGDLHSKGESNGNKTH